MTYSVPDRRPGTATSLPALLPSLGLPVMLVRSTVVAGVDMAGRTLRACTTVDPAALVSALAALPALVEGVGQLVQRIAVTAERVDGVIDGVEDTQARVDRLLDELAQLPAKVDGINDAALTALGRVDGISASAEQSIGRVDSTLDSVSTQVGQVEGIVRRVDGVVDTTGTVLARVGSTVDSAGRVLDGANGIVDKGKEVTDQAAVTLRAADPSVRQLAEITETVTRLQPLLETLREVDPQLSRDLTAMLSQLPGLVGRVDERVFPALSALEGLVPVVRTLNENVDQLQSVVNDVGTLLSGLPGAGRLLKRGGREVRSPENKTSITPPE